MTIHLTRNGYTFDYIQVFPDQLEKAFQISGCPAVYVFSWFFLGGGGVGWGALFYLRAKIKGSIQMAATRLKQTETTHIY